MAYLFSNAKVSLNNTPFIVETKFFDEEKIGEPSLTMLNDSELQVGGETLKNNNNPTEISAYIIRKFHQNTGENPTILEGQSSIPQIPQGPSI